MIAAIIIVFLLAVIAAKSHAPAGAALFGVLGVILLGVQAPAFMAGVGHVLAVVAQGISNGISHATDTATIRSSR